MAKPTDNWVFVSQPEQPAMPEWQMLQKTARVPSMFQQSAGKFKTLRDTTAKVIENFDKFLATDDFRQQKKEIQKALLENGIKTKVSIEWMTLTDEEDYTFREDTINVRILLMKTTTPIAAMRTLVQIGQNLFDSRPHRSDSDSSTWVIKP